MAGWWVAGVVEGKLLAFTLLLSRRLERAGEGQVVVVECCCCWANDPLVGRADEKAGDKLEALEVAAGRVEHLLIVFSASWLLGLLLAEPSVAVGDAADESVKYCRYLKVRDGM